MGSKTKGESLRMELFSMTYRWKCKMIKISYWITEKGKFHPAFNYFLSQFKIRPLNKTTGSTGQPFLELKSWMNLPMSLLKNGEENYSKFSVKVQMASKSSFPLNPRKIIKILTKRDSEALLIAESPKIRASGKWWSWVISKRCTSERSRTNKRLLSYMIK